MTMILQRSPEAQTDQNWHIGAALIPCFWQISLTHIPLFLLFLFFGEKYIHLWQNWYGKSSFNVELKTSKPKKLISFDLMLVYLCHTHNLSFMSRGKTNLIFFLDNWCYNTVVQLEFLFSRKNSKSLKKVRIMLKLFDFYKLVLYGLCFH